MEKKWPPPILYNTVFSQALYFRAISPIAWIHENKVLTKIKCSTFEKLSARELPSTVKSRKFSLAKLTQDVNKCEKNVEMEKIIFSWNVAWRTFIQIHEKEFWRSMISMPLLHPLSSLEQAWVKVLYKYVDNFLIEKIYSLSNEHPSLCLIPLKLEENWVRVSCIIHQLENELEKKTELCEIPSDLQSKFGRKFQ